jgi:hypothetical protein
MEQLSNHESYNYLSQHACVVLDELVGAYREKLPPYDKAILPQEYRPEAMRKEGELYGSKEHGAFFFNACAYMRSTDSGDAIKKLAKLFNERPEFFDMERLADMEAAEVAEALDGYGLGGMRNQNARFWVENARRMMDRFNGDPRRVFDGCESYEDCVERVKRGKDGKGFSGFKEKMASMLLYFYADEGIMAPPEFAWPLPSDRHAVRIFLATKMIEAPSVGEPFYYERLLEPIRGISQEYAETHGVDPLDVTNAVWLLSSELCSNAPGNQSERGSDGRMNPVEVNKELVAQQKRWCQTCGKCALRQYCKLWVPLGRINENKSIIATLKKDNFDEQTSLF